MAAWTAAVRQASTLSRLSASKSANSTRQGALLIQRRGLAGGGDRHGPPLVNFWQNPMHPSKWKHGQQLVFALIGWGWAFYEYTGGKKEKEEEK